MTAILMFYATRADLLPVLQEIEQAEPIKYTRTGRFDDGRARHYPDATALPDLGRARHPSAVACATYMISPKAATIVLREAGGSHIVDQAANVPNVSFSPGGLWGDDILLHGRFAVSFPNEFCTATMKRLRASVRRHFEKIRLFHVGPEAQRMLDAGKRLTLAEQTPRSHDLTRP